ncbi:MAG: rRNA maturation RNase YbeY [Planctomycetes bacterium]|nr:rRNA maturation RNase YbeY [Planctomycetota bacterium]
MPIEVLITDSPHTPKSLRQKMVQAITAIASDFQWNAGQISLAIVDDPTIQEINRQYLNHDYPTDVISFDLSDENANQHDEPYLEGEVIVSWQTAQRVASENQWDPALELLLYVIHGMLHIVGLDDSSPSQSQQMRERERHYMNAIAGDTRNCQQLD